MPASASFRVGSKTDLTVPKFNFRFTRESRLRSDISPCPKSADFVAKVGSSRWAVGYLFNGDRL